MTSEGVVRGKAAVVVTQKGFGADVEAGLLLCKLTASLGLSI